LKAEAYVEMAAAESDHWWFKGRRRIVFDYIGSFLLPHNAEIFEIGCGTGGNFPMLKEFGKIYACDPNAAIIEKLKINYPDVNVSVGTGPSNLPFQDKKFDLIVLIDVLEHIAEDEATLVAIKKKLKPNGFLLFTVPALPILFGPHDEALEHKRRYLKSNLAGLCIKTGYQNKRLTYFNMWLLPLFVMVRLFERFTHKRLNSSVKTPLSALNAIFYFIFSSERFLLRFFELPIGASLLGVWRNE